MSATKLCCSCIGPRFGPDTGHPPRADAEETETGGGACFTRQDNGGTLPGFAPRADAEETETGGGNGGTLPGFAPGADPEMTEAGDGACLSRQDNGATLPGWATKVEGPCSRGRFVCRSPLPTVVT